MELMQHIEQMRVELYQLASGKGFLDPKVLKKSQELDRLIDESMKKPTA